MAKKTVRRIAAATIHENEALPAALQRPLREPGSLIPDQHPIRSRGWAQSITGGRNEIAVVFVRGPDGVAQIARAIQWRMLAVQPAGRRGREELSLPNPQ